MYTDHVTKPGLLYPQHVINVCRLYNGTFNIASPKTEKLNEKLKKISHEYANSRSETHVQAYTKLHLRNVSNATLDEESIFANLKEAKVLQERSSSLFVNYPLIYTGEMLVNKLLDEHKADFKLHTITLYHLLELVLYDGFDNKLGTGVRYIDGKL